MWRRLHKFTLGHAMLLEWLESPFLIGDRHITAPDCALFLLVCSRSIEEAERKCESRFVRWYLRAYLPLRFQLVAVITEISRYLLAFNGHPKCWQKDSNGRQNGTPFLQALKITHMAFLHRTERDTLALPLPIAHHDYAAYWEIKRELKILSEQEESVMEQARVFAEEMAVRN